MLKNFLTKNVTESFYLYITQAIFVSKFAHVYPAFKTQPQCKTCFSSITINIVLFFKWREKVAIEHFSRKKKENFFVKKNVLTTLWKEAYRWLKKKTSKNRNYWRVSSEWHVPLVSFFFQDVSASQATVWVRKANQKKKNKKKTSKNRNYWRVLSEWPCAPRLVFFKTSQPVRQPSE